MSLVPPDDDCPPARNGCMCVCHRTTGIVHHIADFCPNEMPMSMLVRRELSDETKEQLRAIDEAQRAAAVFLASNPIVGSGPGRSEGMSEMLEKVARADAQFCNRDFDGFSKADKRRYMERAAVMVRALREPDDDMLDKMNDLAIDGPGYVSFYPSLHDCGELWKQGIDSILSTPTTRGEVK